MLVKVSLILFSLFWDILWVHIFSGSVWPYLTPSHYKQHVGVYRTAVNTERLERFFHWKSLHQELTWIWIPVIPRGQGRRITMNSRPTCPVGWDLVCARDAKKLSLHHLGIRSTDKGFSFNLTDVGIFIPTSPASCPGGSSDFLGFNFLSGLAPTFHLISQKLCSLTVC